MSSFSTKGTKMTAKYDATCPGCDGAIPAGSPMVFYGSNRPGRKAWHVDCARIEALPSKIFAVGMLALKGDLDEAHWLKIEAELTAELAALKAARVGA